MNGFLKDAFSPIELTVDHNPTMYEERMRIQKAGGTVKDGRVNGIIEVSRSIGDGQFKAHGVTCIPDMKKLTITPNLDQEAAPREVWYQFSHLEKRDG
uniref:PPM-type phosphatase domain-containing protein n=1 Tax=Angiostrongylus cantonensis TaxID=6313 RepID=A0A0K0DCW5_ANGCA